MSNPAFTVNGKSIYLPDDFPQDGDAQGYAIYSGQASADDFHIEATKDQPSTPTAVSDILPQGQDYLPTPVNNPLPQGQDFAPEYQTGKMSDLYTPAPVQTEQDKVAALDKPLVKPLGMSDDTFRTIQASHDLMVNQTKQNLANGQDYDTAVKNADSQLKRDVAESGVALATLPFIPETLPGAVALGATTAGGMEAAGQLAANTTYSPDTGFSLDTSNLSPQQVAKEAVIGGVVNGVVPGLGKGYNWLVNKGVAPVASKVTGNEAGKLFTGGLQDFMNGEVEAGINKVNQAKDISNVNSSDWYDAQRSLQIQKDLNDNGYMGGVGNARKNSGISQSVYDKLGIGKTRSASLESKLPDSINKALGFRSPVLNEVRQSAVQKVAGNMVNDADEFVKPVFEALNDGDMSGAKAAYREAKNAYDEARSSDASYVDVGLENNLKDANQLIKSGEKHFGKDDTSANIVNNLLNYGIPIGTGLTTAVFSDDKDKLNNALEVGALALGGRMGAKAINKYLFTPNVAKGVEQALNISQGTYTPSFTDTLSSIASRVPVTQVSRVGTDVYTGSLQQPSQNDMTVDQYLEQARKQKELTTTPVTPVAPVTPITKPVVKTHVDKFHPLTEATYSGITNAEGAGWYRTKVSVGGGNTSTAYGPAQLTGTTARAILNNSDIHLTKGERNAIGDLVIQSDKMKQYGENDPRYGLGGSGDLGKDAAFRRAYTNATKKYLGYLLNKYHGDANLATKAWRFGEGGLDQTDARYEGLASSVRSELGY